VEVVLDLRIYFDGGVGGVAIHVGGGEVGNSTRRDEEDSADAEDEETASSWVLEDWLEVGVQIGEAMIDGRGWNAHILSLLGERGSEDGLREIP
jgi:hypothetical protein